jgi:DnaA-homolog protein
MKHRCSPQKRNPQKNERRQKAGMKQLILNMLWPAEPSFSNFVPTHNDEAVCALEALACDQQTRWPWPGIYLWGPGGSGRTHLLKACVAAAQEAGRLAVYWPAAKICGPLTEESGSFLAIDDVHALNEEGQIAVFSAYNHAPALGLSLVFSGPCPPLGLHLREDVRTRIGQCLVYELHPPDDAVRAHAIEQEAFRRGLSMGPELIAYILSHAPRDLSCLLALVASLDHASLESQKPVSLPLIRQVMAKDGVFLPPQGNHFMFQSTPLTP